MMADESNQLFRLRGVKKAVKICLMNLMNYLEEFNMFKTLLYQEQEEDRKIIEESGMSVDEFIRIEFKTINKQVK